MKIYIFLFTALIATAQIKAQEESIHYFEFPDKLPPAYNFDAQKEFNDVKKESAKLVSKAKVDQFAEQMTAYKIQSIQSGEVYLGWSEMETYLNTVLKQICPDSCKKNQRIHVYPARNPEFNAYSIHDGSIFFNVSLFAELTNEAAIAFILGHELSHYIHRDVIKSYNKRQEIEVKKEKGKDDSYSSYDVEMAEYGKDQERAADSLGVILAANAGYNVNYAIGSFYKLKNFTEQSYQKANSERVGMAKKNEESISADSLNRIEDLVLANHPDELSRIKYVSKFISKYNHADSKEFLTDQQATFNKLQESSRIETLDLLLGELQFHECTSRSFNYYLLQGTNQYLFYLLESIRRGFELNKSLPNKPFLTEDLRAGIFQKGEGILHNLHAQIRDTSDFKKIKVKALLSKEIAFETWDDAFNYFADQSIQLNYGDGYLPIALRNNDTIPLMNFYLDKYLEKPNRRYSEFAKAIRQDKLLESLKDNKKRLVLLNNITFSFGKGDNFSVQYFHSLNVNPEYSEALENMINKRFPGKEYVNESDLKKNNFRQFYQYDVVLNSLLSAEEVLKKTRSTERYKDNAQVDEYSFEKLFFINPDLWNIFKQNDIRSIHFIKAIAYQEKKSFLPVAGKNSFFSVISCYGDINDRQGIYFDHDQVLRYKMTKPYFLNTMYHNITVYNEK